MLLGATALPAIKGPAVATAEAQEPPTVEHEVSSAPDRRAAFGAEELIAADSSNARSATPELDDEALLANSGRINDLGSALGIGDLQHAAPTGLAGTWAEPEESRLNVWWVGGELPANLQEIAAAEFPDVEIVVRDADTDYATVDRTIQDSGVLDLEGVGDVSVNVDASAVILGHPAAANPDASRASELLDMPVVTVEADIQPMASRSTDTAPLRGGALLAMFDTSVNDWGFCSSGFPVKRAANGTIAYRMLTANHCFRPVGQPNGPIVTPGSIRNGTMSNILYPGYNNGQVALFPDRDLAVMNTGLNLTNFVYGGGVNAPSSQAVEITGMQTSYILNTYLTTNGGNSGEHLVQIDNSVQISNGATNFRDSICNGCRVYVATHPNKRVAAAGGDSGGPVLGDAYNGGQKAAGLIVGGAGDETCNSPLVAVGPVPCSFDVYFSAANAVIQYLNANAGTGWSVAY